MKIFLVNQKHLTYSICMIFSFIALLITSCSENPNKLSHENWLKALLLDDAAEEIPMVMMDTSIIFDPMTYEEEIKVTSMVVNSRDFMIHVLGKNPSDQDIDTFQQKNKLEGTNDLIIIDHLNQKAYQVLKFNPSGDK